MTTVKLHTGLLLLGIAACGGRVDLGTPTTTEHPVLLGPDGGTGGQPGPVIPDPVTPDAMPPDPLTPDAMPPNPVTADAMPPGTVLLDGCLPLPLLPQPAQPTRAVSELCA